MGDLEFGKKTKDPSIKFGDKGRPFEVEFGKSSKDPSIKFGDKGRPFEVEFGKSTKEKLDFGDNKGRPFEVDFGESDGKAIDLKFESTWKKILRKLKLHKKVIQIDSKANLEDFKKESDLG